MKLLLFVFVLLSCSNNPEDPGYEINALIDMKYSVAYESFGGKHFLPVEGTIPRGSLFHTKDENPIASSPAVLERGKYIFNNFCIMCHGETGDGDGFLIPKYPNPPAFKSERVMKLKPKEIFQSMSDGKKDMPSHKGQLSEEDRWKVIYYIQNLQGRLDHEKKDIQ